MKTNIYPFKGLHISSVTHLGTKQFGVRDAREMDRRKENSKEEKKKVTKRGQWKIMANCS